MLSMGLTEVTFLGGHEKKLKPFTMKNVRKLPIVGDVLCGHNSKPDSQQDWSNLLGIRPLPIKLCTIEYSINEQEEAFSSLSLQFSNQNFPSPELKAYDNLGEKLICSVKLRKPTKIIKIKQRNTTNGISKICGLWLVAKDGSDNAKIDLCEGKGQWRIQTLEKAEYIIGFHNYFRADDEIDKHREHRDSINQSQESCKESENG